MTLGHALRLWPLLCLAMAILATRAATTDQSVQWDKGDETEFSVYAATYYSLSRTIADRIFMLHDADKTGFLSETEFSLAWEQLEEHKIVQASTLGLIRSLLSHHVEAIMTGACVALVVCMFFPWMVLVCGSILIGTLAAAVADVVSRHAKVLSYALEFFIFFLGSHLSFFVATLTVIACLRASPGAKKAKAVLTVSAIIIFVAGSAAMNLSFLYAMHSLTVQKLQVTCLLTFVPAAAVGLLSAFRRKRLK